MINSPSPAWLARVGRSEGRWPPACLYIIFLYCQYPFFNSSQLLIISSIPGDIRQRLHSTVLQETTADIKIMAGQTVSTPHLSDESTKSRLQEIDAFEVPQKLEKDSDIVDVPTFGETEEVYETSEYRKLLWKIGKYGLQH